MTAYALQTVPHAGVQPTGVTPANGDTAPTGAGIALMIVNPTGGSSITVSLPIPNVDGSQTVAPRVVTCPAGATPTLIPLPATVYGNGPVTLTYTGTLTAVLASVVTTP